MQKLNLKFKEKSLRYYLRNIFTRQATVIILLVLQAALFVLLYYYMTAKVFAAAYVAQTVLAGITAVFIINTRENPSYKIAWLVPLVVLPGFMSIVYIYVHMQASRLYFTRRVIKTEKHSLELLPKKEAELKKLNEQSTEIGHLANYLANRTGYPVYENTESVYFKVGEEMFKALMEEISKAEKFILLEYFIITDGKMWRDVLKLLLEKAQSGVEVRLLFDGMGSGSLLPRSIDKFLNDNGIKCRVFNPFIPFLASQQNNRDHRKIAIVDGKVAFTGGINLSDEYINIKSRFGHWKDSAVLLRGEAVKSFTSMYFQMWDIESKTETDYSEYLTEYSAPTDGFVIPYGDAPEDEEDVGKAVYLDLINKAKKSIYITAPYFVIDNELTTALAFAAKSGVDVKVLVPGISDKWYVQLMSTCYYRELIPAGVRFFSYTPGFIHQKNFICDEKAAVVGTINTDFRSLYLHFEDAVLMYKTKAVDAAVRDFNETLKLCREIKADDVDKNVVARVFGSVIRAFGPLL